MAKKLKLTGWYSGDQKPVRVGMFHRKYPDGKYYYCWWDGAVFGWGYSSIKDCVNYRARYISGNQSLPWQGVLK